MIMNVEFPVKITIDGSILLYNLSLKMCISFRCLKFVYALKHISLNYFVQYKSLMWSC